MTMMSSFAVVGPAEKPLDTERCRMLSEAFPDRAGSDVRRVFVDSGDSRPVGTTGRERGSARGYLMMPASR